ncbi:MAG TPA: hypothetical protein PLG55_11720, partial [Methanospirillum sp.]|uniref:hypothetical protein n=1 Tax=Methanospirillum sp. TaxID=45200 RepID=UPI002D19AA56
MFHKENTIDVQTDLSVSKPDDYVRHLIPGTRAGRRIQMIGNYEEIHLIKDLLRESLQGLSITEIS